jgi:predicted nucleic acid-binding protein
MDPSGILIDTNVLLRLSRREDPQHGVVSSALEILGSRTPRFYFGLQNIAEFWNVSTRPKRQNGFGLTVHETKERIQVIEQTMTLLPDSTMSYRYWLELVTDYEVRGVQVHDARLVALMMSHQVRTILTLNSSDFSRFPMVQTIDPRALPTSF